MRLSWLVGECCASLVFRHPVILHTAWHAGADLAPLAAGMVQAPEVMYGDPNMMGAGLGSQARLYPAAGPKAAAGGPHGGRSNGPVKSGSTGDMANDVMSGNQLQGGNWVQVMDPEGKVYYLNQGQQ